MLFYIILFRLAWHDDGNTIRQKFLLDTEYWQFETLCVELNLFK